MSVITVTFCQGAILSLGNAIECEVKIEHNHSLKKHFLVAILCVHILQQVSVSVHTKCNPSGEQVWKLGKGCGNWGTGMETGERVWKGILNRL